MFYEIKDKRVKAGGAQTKCWLTAAFSGVVITASFIGIIFWLGITVRQSEPNHERHPPPPSRDYQQHTKLSKPSSSSSPPPPAQFDYPAVEVSKTTVKHKKGRVEMVDNGSSGGGEKLTFGRPDSTTSSNINSSPGSEAGGSMKLNIDEYAAAVENDSPDVQLRSKIAKLSSMQEYLAAAAADNDSREIHLKDGISPLEEILPETVSSAAGSSGSGSGSDSDDVTAGIQSNSVKKKSEAVLPSWYDQNLQNAKPSRPEPSNELKQDAVYELPDFSVIKPDLSAFNTKTIPAFTYLKEPLPPHFERTAAASAGTGAEIGNFDDSLYYHHHHHHHQQQQQQQQPHHHHHHHHHPHQSDYHLPQQQHRQSSALHSVLDDDDGDGDGDGDGDDDDDDHDHQHRQQDTSGTVAGGGSGKDDNSLMNFLQKRLQNVHDWLLYGGKKNRTVDVMEFVKMVNNSFHTKNVGAIFSKFKDLYAGLNTSDVQNMPVSNLLYPTSPSLLNNSTSLVSFGLLAIDLFLLHNVQQIVWNEESRIGDEMLKDPDVVALNALFMSPDRVQQLRQTNSRIFTTDREKKGVVHDLLEFVNGGLRAVLNLSKAYKSSVSKSNANANANANARSKSNGSTLDCIWTLYCRNLDKTAKLHGPYGFLAKMNSLGLRLMMGEFPVEKALDRLMKEYNSGWGPLDCDKLFPRCNAEEAKDIVMQTALGRSTF